jgi:hypothetical protein
METANQVQEGVPSNPSGDQAQTPTNSMLPADVQKYVVETPNAPPNTLDGQGQVQGQSQPQTQQQGLQQSEVAELQRKLNERQIEVYRLQQEQERLKQQQAQAPQQISQQNPYDPQTDWWNALKWETQQAANRAATESSERTAQRLLEYAQQQSVYQQEQQWAMAHPQVDINLVKGFAQMRGIRTLDDAYALMTLPNQIQSAQTHAAQTAFNQFRQPQNVATPVRGGQQAGGTVQLRYEDMARDFQESYGRAYESWSPELKKAFDAETYRRDQAKRGG